MYTLYTSMYANALYTAMYIVYVYTVHYTKLTHYTLQGDRHPGDYTSRADRLLNKDLFEIINEGLYRYEEVII